jgi:hypothetical protein
VAKPVVKAPPKTPEKEVVKETKTAYSKPEEANPKTKPETEKIAEPEIVKPAPAVTSTAPPKPASKPAKKVVEGNGRKIKNISIKESLDALRKQQEPEEEVEEEVIINEFDQETLVAACKSFIESYRSKSPHFVTALEKYEPELKDDYEIAYKVDNSLIPKDVLNVTALLQFLKAELNNNQIKLKPTLTEKSAKKIAYTDREKFDEMAKKYPGLIKLKDQLNLELEF